MASGLLKTSPQGSPRRGRPQPVLDQTRGHGSNLTMGCKALQPSRGRLGGTKPGMWRGMASENDDRVTCAVLIIGDEILSGRTQDTNLRDIARYLGVIGVDLARARTVSDVLEEMQQRLRAIDTTGWRIPEQVDLHIVRAEMNGMLYNLTVLTPWSRDPAYYASIRPEESDTPAEEGPTIHSAIRLWKYPIWPRTRLETSRPLTAEQSADLAGKLRTVPTLLRQARINLARGNAKDLWVGAVKMFEEQHETCSSSGSSSARAVTRRS